jgi:hypothetical protein
MRAFAVVTLILAATVLVSQGQSSSSQTLPIRNPQTVKAQSRLASVACPFTLRKISEHRAVTWHYQKQLGMQPTRVSGVPVRWCGYARWVENLWWKRRVAARKEVVRRVIPVSNDWVTSVKIAQRAFPGTESWLMSCSAAEGGHGRWVTYGGGSYYPGFETRYIVGGPLQYKWPTFKGHYRHALDSLRERGFIVDLPDPENVAAWLSMTAQALAGGWARWSHNDDSHWSASWNTGCR